MVKLANICNLISTWKKICFCDVMWEGELISNVVFGKELNKDVRCGRVAQQINREPTQDQQSKLSIANTTR